MADNKNLILVIFDGFGLSPVEDGNAVFKASTPVFDTLASSFPSAQIGASGADVGLEWGDMGNSEVGHFNLGTGRVVMQDLARINKSIENKTFFQNKELLNAYEFAKKNHSTLHLLGLASDGDVHASLKHLLSLMDLAKEQKITNLAIHVITDGRDTPPKKAETFINEIEKKIKEIGIGRIASLCGRFYAMDRDKHWDDRVKLAYELLTEGKAEKFNSAAEAIKAGYDKGESDENLSPKIIGDALILKPNDSIIFFNFRQDRAKELTKAIVDPDFKDFKRGKFIKNLLFTSFTNYGYEPTNLIKIAFFSQITKNPLAELLALKNLSQFHIAETEKYAHVTYFFNGGAEKPFSNEKRILVPSPRVDSYAKVPQMSALKITNELISYHKKSHPAFTVVNFANPDMVGHTGNMPATVKACETADTCLGKILTTLSSPDTTVILTADHGNAEQMINPETGEIDKEHTTNGVPLIMIDTAKLTAFKNNKDAKMALSAKEHQGVLSDITVTIDSVLGLSKPSEMTGTDLKDLI